MSSAFPVENFRGRFTVPVVRCLFQLITRSSFFFCDNVGTPIIEDLTLQTVPAISSEGKIQGDGRKFLDRFKSYFGSQISSQSLNEINIYR